MSLIQGGRWEGWARRLFSLKGSGATVAQLAPEIVPTAALIPPREEDRILRGDKMYWARFENPAVAGQFSFVMMYNASEDSLVILHPNCIFSTANNNALFQIRIGNTTLGNNSIAVSGRDTRLGLTLSGGKQAGVLYAGQNAALSGTEIARRSVPLSLQEWSLSVPVVIAPGHCVIVWNATVQQNLVTNWAWYERLAEPGELNVV